MIFLRVLSFLGGSFVLFAGPFLLLSTAAGQAASNSPAAILAGALAVLVFALGYYVVAMAGHRAASSPAIGTTVGALLAFQLAAAIGVLFVSHTTQVLLATAPLLCLSVFLLMAFVWPGDSGRSHRPMRRRDPSAMH